MNLKFYKRLYLDNNIENEKEIIKNLSDGLQIHNLYLICVSKNKNHILEIFSVSEAFKEKNKNKEYIVVGLAYGKDSVFQVIKNIFESYILSKKDIGNMKNNFLGNR